MKRPQFIAGAVCPSCQQVDRIVVEQENDQPVRRCVACGYRDDTLPGSGVLPPTRFSRAPGRTGADDAIEPAKVRILENPPPRSRKDET